MHIDDERRSAASYATASKDSARGVIECMLHGINSTVFVDGRKGPYTGYQTGVM